MSELRWNPLLGTWTMVAANRQHRPDMPKGYCPFCPGEGKNVPENYEVYLYPNDFPALSEGYEGEEIMQPAAQALYHTEAAKGACEVILYSPLHEAKLYDLDVAHLTKLVDLWADRVRFYRNYPAVKYVFEFENKGVEVGVTMPHPHGQLYAYPFVPLKIRTELEQCKAYFERQGRNLFSDMIAEEQQDGRRIVFETDSFSVFLPHFTDYPYGLFIVAKDKVLFIDELSAGQRSELADILKQVSGMFDALFDRPFPYMMCMHQGILNSPEWTGQEQFYRFHIEFYPPLRSAAAVKYYASSEMGAWAAANTRAVEETAAELRSALQKFKASQI